MKRAYSASELASLQLPGVPASLSRASNFIDRISRSSPELVQSRSGRGGGRVVDIAALPPEAQAELARREQQAVLASQLEAQDLDAAKRQLATIATADLTARQRAVMDARSTVLLAIEARMLAQGVSRSAAVRLFLDDIRFGAMSDAQRAVLARANDRAGEERLVGKSQLHAWFAARDRAGIAGLAPALTRQKEDLPAWFSTFQTFYARPTKPSIRDALRAYCATLPAGAFRPSERQARIALAKVPLLNKLKGREGALAMRARLAYTARDFLPLLPTSVYSADGKTFDAEVAHPIHGQPFRPEITTIVDVGTRRIVGWSAALDENTFAVVDALRRASAIGGVPAIFYTDRGPGYRNKAMTSELSGFLGRAGITPMHALPYNSQAKGVIERINQIYTATAKNLPTYLGKDMDKEAKLVAFKRSRKELALAGRSNLLPSWSDFLDAIDVAIDTYNNRPHSELPKVLDVQLGRKRHLTPNEFWEQKCAGFEPIIPDEAELDDMFRPYVVRRTRRALVDWLGNSYFALALEPHHGQDVAVGYDIRDASRVWVREIELVDDERKPGKLIAIATYEGHKTRYVPLSYEQAAMERRQKGRLSRVERKADVIRQELAPHALIDLSAAPVLPIQEFAPAFAEAHQTPVIASAEPRLAGERPMFRDDASLARWLVANPQLCTEADRAYLGELLSSHSTTELLRMSGIDLHALRKLRTDPRPPEQHREGQPK